MVKKDVVVMNEEGLHARPCRMIVDLAATFKANIKFVKEGYEVNAKSILGVLSLAARKGSVVTIIAEGVDEKEAVESIAKLFESKFDEE